MARSQELTEAISALITQQPFYAVLMLDLLEVVECEKFPSSGRPNATAATDSKRLYVNPKFFKGLAIKERMFVLAHEVMHVVYRHPQRMSAYNDRTFGPDLKPFNPKKYNYAGDYVINRALCDANVGKMPMNSLYHPDITADDIIDEVYCKIPDPPEDDENWDQHLPGAGEGPDKATIQRAVKSAANAAKAQGKMPAGMGRLVDEICEPQVPWGEKIRKAIVSTVGGDTSTWSRPNRRKLAVAPHFYWPGRTGSKSGPMAIEVDTSGSIAGDELSTFLGEIHGILTDVRPEKIHVMFVDSQLYNDEVVEIDDPNDILILKQKAGGGGGTDMEVVFRELETRQIEVEYVIVLTDGYCDFGEDRGIPTIWCITSDRRAPWGETINIKIQKQREAA